MLTNQHGGFSYGSWIIYSLKKQTHTMSRTPTIAQVILVNAQGQTLSVREDCKIDRLNPRAPFDVRQGRQTIDVKANQPLVLNLVPRTEDWQVLFRAFYDEPTFESLLSPLQSGMQLTSNITKHTGNTYLYVQTPHKKWRKGLKRLLTRLKAPTRIDEKHRQILLRCLDKSGVKFYSQPQSEITSMGLDLRKLVIGTWLKQVLQMAAVIGAPIGTHYLMKYYQDPRMQSAFDEIDVMIKLADPALKRRLKEAKAREMLLRQKHGIRR